MSDINPVVNIYINQNEEEEYLNPKDLAKKYDVNYEESDNDEEKEEEMAIHQQIHDTSEIAHRMDSLLVKLENKNREVERLCTLLEAVTVVPGIDPAKYLDIYDGNGEEAVDPRDIKIISLAKKCRKLTVALNKERSGTSTSKRKIEQLEKEVERLKEEIQLISSPAARAAARRGQEPRNDTDERSLSAELQSAQKQLEDMRRKYQSSQDEVKKLTRTLVKELGDGVSLEDAVDEGWRGRAQQIVMLKAKIRKLQSEGNAGTMTSTTASRNNVDAKAQDELRSMMSERQQAVEELSIEYNRAMEEVKTLKSKLDRKTVRVKALESDAALHKQQLRVLVEQTDGDNQLIEALRAELSRVKQQLKAETERHREVEANAVPKERRVQMQGTAKGGNDAEELLRLQRLCKQQADQLETQDTVIRQLRAAAPRK